MHIALSPVSKPRMTRRDAWAQRPAVVRYHVFCDSFRRLFPYPLPEILVIRFFIPMPKSWSTKKREQMLGAPHQQKPDVDNLCKAVMDALSDEDSFVYVLHAEKIWSSEGGIEILMDGEYDERFRPF